MATITYSFVVRNGGDPTAATGLTPTFVEFREIVAGTDLSGSAPTIVEVGNGHYKFTLDWDTAPFDVANHIAMVVDAGLGLTEASERYITGRINEDDSFADDLAAGQTTIQSNQATIASNQATTHTNQATTHSNQTTILANQAMMYGVLTTLLEIETGKWEVIGNQLHIYESDGATLVKSFNLYDAAGLPTSSLPARREPIP